jgi:hypothetical protein
MHSLHFREIATTNPEWDSETCGGVVSTRRGSVARPPASYCCATQSAMGSEGSVTVNVLRPAVRELAQ